MIGKPRSFGNAIVVLAGEKSRSKRRPDGGSILMLVEKGSILDLKAFTVEGVVPVEREF